MKQTTMREYLRGKTYKLEPDKLIIRGREIHIRFEGGYYAPVGKLEEYIIKHLDKPFNISGNVLCLIEQGYNGIFKKE